MKLIRNIIPFFVVIVVLLVTVPLFAKDAMNKEDYLAQAKKYEDMASEQDAMAKVHQAMVKTYKLNQGRFPKATRDKIVADMQKHCEVISTQAQKLAEEYKAFAQWHKDRASDLQ